MPALVVGLCLLAGCVNEPGMVGSGLIPAGDFLKTDSLVLRPRTSYSVLTVPDTVNAGRTVIAVGKTASAEAWGLARFTNFGAIYDSIDVLTAEIRLQTAFHQGDSAGQVSFAVRKALKSWAALSFTYADLRSPGFYEDPPRSTHDLGSVGDTVDIAIPLDTALVNSWFRSDSTNPNYGIVFEPTNSTVIKGFVNPRLVITYIPDGASDPDTVTFASTSGNYGFVLGGIDTSAFQDSIALQIRAGAASRAILGFDIAALPRLSAIHRALLEVSADESLFDRSSNMRDSLMATFRDQLGFVLQFEALSAAEGSGSERVYSFNVTSFVQFWVQGTGIPEIGLRAVNERNGVEGFVLHGSAAADSTRRPRLRILYSPTLQ